MEVNKEPIFVDFANCDEDGAIRLITRGTLDDLNRMGLQLTEGQKILVTDNEIEMTGTVTFRDGMWVAIPDEKGFKKVDENAPHHIKNIKE